MNSFLILILKWAKPCHPEWSKMIRNADHLAESRDLLSLSGRIQLFLLTSSSRNCTVTHYAEPFGYIFSRSNFSGSCRPHPSRRPRSAQPGQPARRRNCRSFSRLPPCHLQTPAHASPRPPRPGASRRAPPGLPAQSRAPPRRRFLARPVPQLLETEPHEPKDI